MTDLGALFDAAARGSFPAADGSVELLAPAVGADAAVVSFTDRSFVAAEVDAEWLAAHRDESDPASVVSAPFVTALSAATATVADTHDVVLAALPVSDVPPADVTPVPEGYLHPRLERALRFRTDVSAYVTDGGLLIFGTGFAGRQEVAIEVDPSTRGRGVGSKLASAARSLAPRPDPLFVQIAPGNVASLRMVLRAGFVPVASEILFTR